MNIKKEKSSFHSFTGILEHKDVVPFGLEEDACGAATAAIIQAGKTLLL